MRVGEAIRLDREDLDLAAGVVTVRDSKFGKSRELPLHPTTVAALREYLRLRDAHQLAAGERRVADLASRHPADLLQRARDLPELRADAGLTARSSRVPPTHPRSPPQVRRADAARLVPRTASRCNPGCRCCAPISATSHPGTRYWYLQAAPELLAIAAAAARGSARRPAHERARADPAGVLHRAADRPAQRQPAHDRRLPRHDPTAVARSPPQRFEREPSKLDIADLDADTDRRVPRPPRDRARQQRQDPQRPAGGDPFALPLRRAAPPRTRPGHPARARDPTQTHRPSARHVPRPSRRSTRCSPHPTARPGPAGATTRCCCPRSRPGCAPPSSPA